jgi:hypothetical protein
MATTSRCRDLAARIVRPDVSLKADQDHRAVSPGGPADTAVRIPQANMEKALGQPIVIEKVAGATGQVGAMRVKQSEPTAKPLVDEGRVVGLAVTSADEWFNLPGLNPLVPLGLKDFVVPGWNGLMAPKVRHPRRPPS